MFSNENTLWGTLITPLPLISNSHRQVYHILLDNTYMSVPQVKLRSHNLLETFSSQALTNVPLPKFDGNFYTPEQSEMIDHCASMTIFTFPRQGTTKLSWLNHYRIFLNQMFNELTQIKICIYY